MSFYRIQDADRDAAELLDPEQQWSQSWGLGDLRHGVSVCASPDDLADYFVWINRDMHADDRADVEFLSSMVLVEIDGAVSDEEDMDAAQGALLILPTRIISVGPIPADMVATICGE